jgi:hypothetical protein
MNPGPEPAGIVYLQQLLIRIITLSTGFAFLIVMLIITYAGFRFITSGGDPKTIQSARQMITYAIIGIVMLALAWIAILMVESFTQLELTDFCLGFPESLTQCPERPNPNTRP